MSAAAVLSAAKLMCGMLYVTKLFVVGVWLLSTQTNVTRRELRCLKFFQKSDGASGSLSAYNSYKTRRTHKVPLMVTLRSSIW